MLKDALGAWCGSEEEISRQIEAEPLNAQVWASRAGVRRAAGDLEGALSYLGMAIKLGVRFRERITVWGNRGMIRFEIGDYEGAIDDFSSVIEARPRNAIVKSALLQRALVKEKIGDKKGSAADRQLARILSPGANN